MAAGDERRPKEEWIPIADWWWGGKISKFEARAKGLDAYESISCEEIGEKHCGSKLAR
jgi:hypothetical protein